MSWSLAEHPPHTTGARRFVARASRRAHRSDGEAEVGCDGDGEGLTFGGTLAEEQNLEVFDLAGLRTEARDYTRGDLVGLLLGVRRAGVYIRVSESGSYFIAMLDFMFIRLWVAGV